MSMTRDKKSAVFLLVILAIIVKFNFPILLGTKRNLAICNIVCASILNI